MLHDFESYCQYIADSRTSEAVRIPYELGGTSFADRQAVPHDRPPRFTLE